VRGTGRRPAVLVVALVLVAWLVGVAAPPAGAHTGNGGSNFRTTFTDPGAACLHWSVAGADGFVSLRSDCPGTVVVLGYQDEPYLELSAGGVRENRNSPATYLNADARGNSPVPSTVDAGAAPDWQQRADRPEYRWHDHRTHWMSGLPPETGGRAAVVLDWTIPVELAGEGPGATAVRVAAAGELFYAPPLGPWVPLVLAGVPVVAVAVLAAAGGARPRPPIHLDKGNHCQGGGVGPDHDNFVRVFGLHRLGKSGHRLANLLRKRLSRSRAAQLPQLVLKVDTRFPVGEAQLNR